jgi:hypothetical protein
MRTEGDARASNAVDAQAMLRFALGALRQLVARHGNRDRLRALLTERARRALTEGEGATAAAVGAAGHEARLAERSHTHPVRHRA